VPLSRQSRCGTWSIPPAPGPRTIHISPAIPSAAGRNRIPGARRTGSCGSGESGHPPAHSKALPTALGFNCCQMLPTKYARFRSRQKSRHLSETAFNRPSSERELLSTRRTYTPATVTSMIRPVNISVTNSLPVFGSSAMLVGVIRQLAITTGGPPGEVNSCNLPGACAN
jgi:hypothetical protein